MRHFSHTQKSPRGKGLTLELRPAADILAEVSKRFPKLCTVAFAALDDGDVDRSSVIPASPVIPAKAGIQPTKPTIVPVFY